MPFFKEIVDSVIDWITISIDGVGERYNSIRKPLRFDEEVKLVLIILSQPAYVIVSE